MAFNKKYFTEHLNRFRQMYQPAELLAKLAKVAKKIGRQAAYLVLVLYYASLDSRVPVKDRLLILAALGYFICPADFIPDALPGGFVDDMGALTFVVKKVWSNLTPEVLAKARKRLEEWFGPVEIDALKLPGEEPEICDGDRE